MLRTALIEAINSRLQREAPSGREAAELLGIARSRAIDLLAGRAERFSLDALVMLAASAGLTVRITATRPYRKS